MNSPQSQAVIEEQVMGRGRRPTQPVGPLMWKRLWGLQGACFSPLAS